jgi:nitrate reductase gamma subunit
LAELQTMVDFPMGLDVFKFDFVVTVIAGTRLLIGLAVRLYRRRTSRGDWSLSTGGARCFLNLVGLVTLVDFPLGHE